ncbi:MAG: site-specific integrase [Planctomycetia bacterium]|nr:site-specific integrase [Planctomycetia bacterium]
MKTKGQPTTTDEIRVTVCNYPDRANLVLRYVDPITGKQKTKSAKTPDESAAIGKAAVWEEELRTGRYMAPSRMTWQEFRKRVADEKLAPMPRATQEQYRGALNCFERLAGPDRLVKVTATLLTRFSTKARAEGVRETTLHKHLRHLKAVFRWAERQGLLAKCPTFEMPKLPKGQSKGKHRAVTLEEVEKMILAVPKVRPRDAAQWERILWGLWYSGLRLSEAVALTWDDGPFVLDTTGQDPAFYIDSTAQKSRRTEAVPVAPDFVDWILAETPEAERRGRVFPLHSDKTGGNLSHQEAGVVICAIGERSGVVVGTTEKVSRDDAGRIVRTTVNLFPGAHDLRRGFCSKWARKVPAPVLQRLARHSSITTTQSYYIHLTVADITADLRAALGATEGSPKDLGNISGNMARKSPSKRRTEKRRKSLP